MVATIKKSSVQSTAKCLLPLYKSSSACWCMSATTIKIKYSAYVRKHCKQSNSVCYYMSATTMQLQISVQYLATTVEIQFNWPMEIYCKFDTNGKFSAILYVKRFTIIHFPHLESNITIAAAYEVYGYSHVTLALVFIFF